MLEPLPSSQWNEKTAAHLINRAGFGGNPQQIENLRLMGPDKAVSHFVDYDGVPDPTPPPDWAKPDPDAQQRRSDMYAQADDMTRRALTTRFLSMEDAQVSDLRYWWVRRMALGPRPFQEKMTLFWHGHFATSFEKVRNGYYLWLQNETLRRNALAPFGQLLAAISQDPAMLLYLDGAYSNKNHPNENFAREVLELFTLGEGHYTEQDIQQSAKAYTGWGISKDGTSFEYHPNNHDNGPKTVFGQTGNYTGTEMLDVICRKEQCAKFIATKIWRFFVQDQPPAALMEALAANFHASGLDLRQLMTTIFRSKEFYAPDVIRSQIKSPVQWVLASTNQMQAALPTEPMTLVMLLLLGQVLFEPPNVKGWDGGIAWITTTSLLNRYNFAAALIEGERIPLPSLRNQMVSLMNHVEDEDSLLQMPPASVAGLFSAPEVATPDAFLAALQKRFLNGKLEGPRLASLHDFVKAKSPLQEIDIRKAIRLIMSTPEYQLT